MQDTGLEVRSLPSCILHPASRRRRSSASCPLLPAQTPRLPEPAPSASARMFEQLNSDDWILQAEALDYLSRYDVPGAAGPVKAIVKGSSGNHWLQARGMVALSRIEPANAVGLAPQEARE